MFYDGNKLINPKNDIKNFRKFELMMTNLFNDFYILQNNEKPDLELAKIFIENITNPYPKYSDEELIRVREILKKMFFECEDFKYTFFAILNFDKMEHLRGWTSKFPTLFNDYLDGLKGFSEQSIKNFFSNKKKNPSNVHVEKAFKYTSRFQ